LYRVYIYGSEYRGLVWRNRKKISQIIKDYFHLPFFLLIILCCLPMQLTDWLLVEVALLLIGLTKIRKSLRQNGFDHQCVIASPLRLPAQLLVYNIVIVLNQTSAFISRVARQCSMQFSYVVSLEKAFFTAIYFYKDDLFVLRRT
jgi:hypothetical protein